MSEESQKLRVRPRLTLEVAPPSPEPIEEEAPVQNTEEPLPVDTLPLEAPPFPLPSLPPFEPTEAVTAPAEEGEPATAESEFPPPEAAEFESAPPAPPEFELAPSEAMELETPPPEVEAEQPVKLKMALRPRAKETDLVPAPPPPPPPPPSLGTSGLPAGGVSPRMTPPTAQSGEKSSRGTWMIGFAALLLLAVVGYVAYEKLFADSGSSSSEFSGKNRAKLLSKDRRPAPPAGTVPDEKAAPTADSPSDETVKIDGDAAQKIAVTEVSPAFRAWVSGLKITGVRSGDRPKLLVAQKLYSLGELMNVELGITFDGYDPGRHVVRFKDKAGFVLEREDR